MGGSPKLPLQGRVKIEILGSNRFALYFHGKTVAGRISFEDLQMFICKALGASEEEFQAFVWNPANWRDSGSQSGNSVPEGLFPSCALGGKEQQLYFEKMKRCQRQKVRDRGIFADLTEPMAVLSEEAAGIYLERLEAFQARFPDQDPERPKGEAIDFCLELMRRYKKRSHQLK